MTFNLDSAIDSQTEMITLWQGRANAGEPGAADQVVAAIEGLRRLQEMKQTSPPSAPPETPPARLTSYQVR